MYNKKYKNLFKDKKYKYDLYRIKQNIPYNFNLKYLNYKYYKYFFHIFNIFRKKSRILYVLYV